MSFSHWRPLLAVSFFLLAGLPAFAQNGGAGSNAAAVSPATGSAANVEELLLQRLHRQLAAKAEQTNGLLAVALVDLKSGRQLCLHCDTAFPTASTIKVPVLIELLAREEAGTLRLADVVTITAAESVPSSRSFDAAVAAGGRISLDELARIMIRDSDNAATNKLIGIVGMEAVNARMETLGLGGEIRLRRKMIDLAAGREGRENVATPRAMAQLAAMLEQGRAVSPEVSRKALQYMQLVRGAFRQAAGPNTPVATKTGALTGVECEMGVIRLNKRPFALAVYTAYLEEASPLTDVTRIVLQTMEKLAKANSAGRFL